MVSHTHPRQRKTRPMTIDDILKGKASVSISGHVRPDGDCVGSCMSVYNYIATHYPDMDVHVYLDPIPNIYKFMKNTDRIEQVDKKHIMEFDLFICLDCHEYSRLGDSAKVAKKAGEIFCVDHHLGEKEFAGESYIFPEASSACELVAELMPIDRVTEEIAECLYTGIVDDTGVFQYTSTSPSTMRKAAQLMEKGIPFSRIIEKTFFEKTYNQMRIFAHALLKARLHFDGRIISSYITKAEMEEFEVEPKHMEGIVSQLRDTKGVEVSIFLYETKNEGYKVSTRAGADCNINLAELCASFGGGGHAKAAGFQIHKTPDEAVSIIVEKVEKALLALEQ